MSPQGGLSRRRERRAGMTGSWAGSAHEGRVRLYTSDDASACCDVINAAIVAMDGLNDAARRFVRMKNRASALDAVGRSVACSQLLPARPGLGPDCHACRTYPAHAREPWAQHRSGAICRGRHECSRGGHPTYAGSSGRGYPTASNRTGRDPGGRFVGSLSRSRYVSINSVICRPRSASSASVSQL